MSGDGENFERQREPARYGMEGRRQMKYVLKEDDDSKGKTGRQLLVEAASSSLWTEKRRKVLKDLRMVTERDSTRIGDPRPFKILPGCRRAQNSWGACAAERQGSSAFKRGERKKDNRSDISPNSSSGTLWKRRWGEVTQKGQARNMRESGTLGGNVLKTRGSPMRVKG